VETEGDAKAWIDLLNSGADFADLAREHSTGPSGPNGGQLGWFGPGAMVKPFEEAVMALEVGAVSDPVQTQFGWHVIRLNETREQPVPTLDEVRADLVSEIERAAAEANVMTLIDAATIELTEGLEPDLLLDTTLLDD
jgi:peptidyl-prolyl cis-trans isomerase C